MLGRGGALLAAPPEFEPFRFRRLLAGRCVSAGEEDNNDKKGIMVCLLSFNDEDAMNKDNSKFV